VINSGLNSANPPSLFEGIGVRYPWGGPATTCAAIFLSRRRTA